MRRSPGGAPRFALPAPETFQPTAVRELPLTAAEQGAVLAQARKDKYAAAHEQWYRWKIVQQEQPQAFTFEQIGAWFQAEALRRLGRPFVLDEANRRIVRALFLYFAEDPRFEAEGFGRLDKGLLLRGGVGCGKTTLLTVFSHNPRLPFLVKPCRELVGEYTEQGTPGQPAGGEDALGVYTKLIPRMKGNDAAYNYRPAIGLALDDIGTEDWTAKHYGRQLSVVEHILGYRDDAVVAGEMPRWATHATTNLPFDDVLDAQGQVLLRGLGHTYGARVRSRMRGLFNVLTFPETAPDRRA